MGYCQALNGSGNEHIRSAFMLQMQSTRLPVCNTLPRQHVRNATCHVQAACETCQMFGQALCDSAEGMYVQIS